MGVIGQSQNLWSPQRLHGLPGEADKAEVGRVEIVIAASFANTFGKQDK